MERWTPPLELTKREQVILKLVAKARKLFTFLRLHRRELFDDGFQLELESMYRTTGAGSEPIPPAFMCMVLLLQGYLRVSDAEAVVLSVTDARWQLVLGCMGVEEAPFSQGYPSRHPGVEVRPRRHSVPARCLNPDAPAPTGKPSSSTGATAS